MTFKCEEWDDPRMRCLRSTLEREHGSDARRKMAKGSCGHVYVGDSTVRLLECVPRAKDLQTT